MWLEKFLSNHLLALLSEWHQNKDDNWVLGTIFRTSGSAYRKSGAMMLINQIGQYYGMLSGGCLEADIIKNSRMVLSNGQPKTLIYDSTDEDDWSTQLGIGCGGRIEIILQLVTPENDLALESVYLALKERQSGYYHQHLDRNQARFIQSDDHKACRQPSITKDAEEEEWLVTPIKPEPHILVIGGGKDAIPVANIASQIGWTISICEPRPGNQNIDGFPRLLYRLKEINETIESFIQSTNVKAVIVMTHNLNLDAAGIKACKNTGIEYLALLGPIHRYQQVMEIAEVEESDMPCNISSPAGFDIGGNLPESIALSIISECHANLYKAPILGDLK